MIKKIYFQPEVISHQPIKFETTISGNISDPYDCIPDISGNHENDNKDDNNKNDNKDDNHENDNKDDNHENDNKDDNNKNDNNKNDSKENNNKSNH